MNAIILLLTAFGVLSVIASFRLQIHQNNLNSSMETSTNFGYNLMTRTIVDRHDPLKAPTNPQIAIDFLQDIIAVLEQRNRTNALNVSDSIGLEVLKKLREDLIQMDERTKKIKRMFNVPFILSSVMIIISYIFPGCKLIEVIDILLLVVLLWSSYALFNYSYKHTNNREFGDQVIAKIKKPS